MICHRLMEGIGALPELLNMIDFLAFVNRKITACMLDGTYEVSLL
jgi:hypothetical protein